MPLDHMPRGLLSVRAQKDIHAETLDAIGRVDAAVGEFKRDNEARFGAIESRLDDAAHASAASLIGGGSASAPAMARAYDDFRAALRGAPRAEMHTGSGPDGGFMVPDLIDTTITNQVVDLNPLRRVSQVVVTTTGNYTRLVNARGASSGWAAERDEREETATPKLKAIEPPGGELYAIVTASNHSIEDAQFDVPAFLANNVTTEFAVAEGQSFITGDGLKKPSGILGPLDAPHATSAAGDDVRPFGTLQHVATGNANGFDSTDPADSLFELVSALRPGYRNPAECVFVMNSKTAGYCRMLKDVNGRFVWQPSLQAGQPNLLLGYPVLECEGMPDIAENATPVAFGNFRAGYLIVDRRGVTVIADRVTRPGFSRYYFSKRVGGSILDSNAIKLMKIASA